MFNSIIMLRIELAIILTCTTGLIVAGLQGVFIESVYIRPLQFLTIALLFIAIAVYLRLLSLKSQSIDSND